ncbi:TraB/VirB10 family protein [Polymorphobacter sp. PAMC 29334]|uniref:TraB/VirB10 family protein n=1 Tax=Polymorphobacter sp. PAMC 29334 TaxID=2862331 RepID=UPI001D034413|nr:TraB/VirB10 family protein [Polymorphobacter sp. PAMC 29334]
MADRDMGAGGERDASGRAARGGLGRGRVPDPRDPLGGVNARTKKRQAMWLAGISGVVLLAGSSYIFSGSSKPVKNDPSQPLVTKISTDDMVGKNLADKAWRSQAEVIQSDQSMRLKTIEGEVPKVQTMQQQIADLQQQNAAMKANGEKVLQVLNSDNAAKAAQIEVLRKGGGPTGGTPVAGGAEPFRVAGSSAPTYGPAAGGYDAQGRPMVAGAAGAPGGMPSIAEVKTISFGGQGATVGGPSGKDPIGFKLEHPDAPPTVVEDSIDYLPPNSYASAKVIVGVDASAGVQSQTDPLPVVLRITGPARSVVQNGRVLTTKLEGCIVNGAARGDLSAEKIYVKLAKMTCDQPGGRVAVSEVKGFISFGGKTGVRGRVVTREGGLIGQAFLAGIAGGFGRAFTANTDSVLQGSNVTVNGTRQLLGPGAIATGGLGEGVSKAGDMVSKYLIERAEQYQPVIEMPTGIDVEIVFLDGVYVRSSK